MEESFVIERGVLLLFQEKDMGKEYGSRPEKQGSILHTGLKSRIYIFGFVLPLFLGKRFSDNVHCLKNARIRVFSDLHIPVF